MSTSEFPLRATVLALLASLAITGCTLGPNFVRPRAATPTTFNRVASAHAASKPVESKFNVRWWTLLDDPLLDSLEKQLADANLDVAAASARLRQSRAQQIVAGAVSYPTLAGAASYERERGSENGILSLLGVTPSQTQPQSASGSAPLGVSSMPGSKGSPAYNLYQSGFDASWEIDIWGRNRRGVEAATALAQAAYENRNAVLLSARAELARDYIELRETQALLSIAGQNLRVARETVKLTRIRVSDGVTTELDVANASSQSVSIKSLIPTLKSHCETIINAIGVLLGREPGALRQTLAPQREIPQLPRQLPIGFASEVVRRRPDIRMAEAKLHAATALIGVAKADFYPNISLNGSAGFQSLQLSNLGSWASGQFVVGPSISLPIFEGGRLTGMLHLRQAQQQEAAINYQHTVLTAWQEVDDALVVYEAEQHRRDRLAEVVALSQRALAIAQQRYKAGAADFLNVLTAQKRLLAAQSRLARSKATADTNLVTLCKALGGGWEATYGKAYAAR